MQVVEVFHVAQYIVEIHADLDPPNPRKEMDNLGVMVCWHRRAHYGDEQVRNVMLAMHSLREVESWLKKERDAVVVLPIYIYEHGPVILSARYEDYLRWPDHQWDCGQVGYIYVARESLKKEYGVTRISKKTKQMAAQVLAGEVDTYNQYLNGDVYGYVIADEEGDHAASCGGIFGLDYAREAAKEAVACLRR